MSMAVLVLSVDTATTSCLNALFLKRKYSITIENSKLKSIYQVLDTPIDLIVLDVASDDKSIFDYLRIIKKIRPKVQIITLLNDISLHNITQLRSFGIFYTLFKPINSDEVEHVLDAFESKMQHDFNVSFRVSRIKR